MASRSNVVVLFILACLFAVVAFIICTGVKRQQETEKVVEAYYQQYNNKNFQYIYDDLFDEGAKSKSSPDRIAYTYQKTGKYESRSLQSFKLLSRQEKVYYFTFNTTYEKGQQVDSFLVKDAGNSRYLIENFPGNQ